MELFLFSGTLASILANDLVWKTPPSVKQLEDEKYWETQIKLWEMQRKREIEFPDQSGTVMVNESGKVMATDLPTSDPSNVGQLWNDSGTVKISAG